MPTEGFVHSLKLKLHPVQEAPFAAMEDFHSSNFCTFAGTIVRTMVLSKVPLTRQQLEFVCMEIRELWRLVGCDMVLIWTV